MMRQLCGLALVGMLLGCSTRQNAVTSTYSIEIETTGAAQSSPQPKVSVLAIGGLIDGEMVWWGPDGEVTQLPQQIADAGRTLDSFNNPDPNYRWVVLAGSMLRTEDRSLFGVRYRPAEEPVTNDSGIYSIWTTWAGSLESSPHNSFSVLGYPRDSADLPLRVLCEIPTGEWKKEQRVFDDESLTLFLPNSVPSEGVQTVRILQSGPRPDRMGLLVEGDSSPIASEVGTFDSIRRGDRAHIWEFRDTGVARPNHREYTSTRIDEDGKYYLNERHYTGVEMSWMGYEELLLENLPAMPNPRALASK